MQGMQEMRVRSLGREDSLEKEMATHSSILSQEMLRTEEPGYSPWGHKRVRNNLATEATASYSVTAGDKEVQDSRKLHVSWFPSFTSRSPWGTECDGLSPKKSLILFSLLRSPERKLEKPSLCRQCLTKERKNIKTNLCETDQVEEKLRGNEEWL